MEYGINDDYLDDDDDGIMYSTKNYCSDSDDEILSAFMPRKIKQKRSVSKSENKIDDFEKDMAAELQETVKKLTAPLCSSSTDKNDEEEQTYYDKIYFDSDEEDGPPSKSSRKEKHKILSNDDLFYDPLMDEDDQEWVDNNRRSYQVRRKRLKNSTGGYQPEPLPQSDAVLNCPACFTTLCLDCQRHEIYNNQYRAMFVFNCVVDKSEILHFSVKESKKKFKKRKNKKPDETKTCIDDKAAASSSSTKISSCVDDEAETTSNGTDDLPAAVGPQGLGNEEGTMNDKFNPVRCTVCNTKVAVQDQSEVYHFFNILTSY